VTTDDFHGAIPFDLWNIVPPSLAAVLPNVMWSRDRLHRLVLPVVTLPVSELRWQLELPWWRVDRPFTVTPNQVRHEPRTYARHWQRTVDAELRFPIHLLQRDRLIVLDGVHRLLKADVQELQHVSAHVVSHALFMDHIVERSDRPAGCDRRG
jgi:hypothetical protein